MAGARVKKLSTTDTFHSQGAERNCQRERQERQNVSFRRKKKEETSRPKISEQRHEGESAERDIAL